MIVLPNQHTMLIITIFFNISFIFRLFIVTWFWPWWSHLKKLTWIWNNVFIQSFVLDKFCGWNLSCFNILHIDFWLIWCSSIALRINVDSPQRASKHLMISHEFVAVAGLSVFEQFLMLLVFLKRLIVLWTVNFKIFVILFWNVAKLSNIIVWS